MKVRAISFDYWNTLFTERSGAYKFYHENRLRRLTEAIRACGDFTGDQIEQACLSEAQAHYQVWTEQHRTLPTAERVGKVLTSLNACLPEDQMRELIKVYEEGILERPPVPVKGVQEALERLAGRYRLGIISDVGFAPGRVLREVLRQNDMLEMFDSLVFSDEAGRSKPHRDVFERTTENLRATPAHIVHIGDLEHTDIIGARRAGFHAIRFTGVTPMNEGESTIADHVIEDYSELPHLVQPYEDEDETTELAGSRKIE